MQTTSRLHCPWCGDNLTIQADNLEECFVVCETAGCPKPSYSHPLWDTLNDATEGERIGLIEEYAAEYLIERAVGAASQ